MKFIIKITNIAEFCQIGKSYDLFYKKKAH